MKKRIPFNEAQFPAPPVYTGCWDDATWLNWAQIHNTDVEVYYDEADQRDIKRTQLGVKS